MRFPINLHLIAGSKNICHPLVSGLENAGGNLQLLHAQRPLVSLHNPLTAIIIFDPVKCLACSETHRQQFPKDEPDPAYSLALSQAALGTDILQPLRHILFLSQSRSSLPSVAKAQG